MTDSGPPYPAPTGTGFDVWRTIISQYSNSPILTTLITDLFAYLDQSASIDEFYDLIMNVDTAQGYGLDVWGRIVNVNRVLQVPTSTWFGFAEALPGTVGFNQATFYTGDPITENYVLSDDAYRTLIYAKAAANITNGSVPAINRILMTLFDGDGNAYVTDTTAPAPYFGFEEAGGTTMGFNQAPFYAGQPFETMTISYTFNFTPTPVQLAIIQSSGVLPKPVGVAANINING